MLVADPDSHAWADRRELVAYLKRGTKGLLELGIYLLAMDSGLL